MPRKTPPSRAEWRTALRLIRKGELLPHEAAVLLGVNRSSVCRRLTGVDLEAARRRFVERTWRRAFQVKADSAELRAEATFARGVAAHYEDELAAAAE